MNLKIFPTSAARFSAVPPVLVDVVGRYHAKHSKLSKRFWSSCWRPKTLPSPWPHERNVLPSLELTVSLPLKNRQHTSIPTIPCSGFICLCFDSRRVVAGVLFRHISSRTLPSKAARLFGSHWCKKKKALARMYNNPLYLYVAVGGKTMGKNYKSTVGGRILANQFIWRSCPLFYKVYNR